MRVTILSSLVHTKDSSLALQALPVLSGSTEPSFNILRGDLATVSILRDSLHSINQVGSNLVK